MFDRREFLKALVALAAAAPVVGGRFRAVVPTAAPPAALEPGPDDVDEVGPDWTPPETIVQLQSSDRGKAGQFVAIDADGRVVLARSNDGVVGVLAEDAKPGKPCCVVLSYPGVVASARADSSVESADYVDVTKRGGVARYAGPPVSVGASPNPEPFGIAMTRAKRREMVPILRLRS